jgi:DNA-binding NarL/FixJ family response regulator
MNKIKLLLADDHQIVLAGLIALLEKEPGLEIVCTARNSEETLNLMAQHTIEVAILDISMPPGIDGVETAKLIRKSYPKTKIILLTMIGDGHYILNALKLGIHGYVMKEKSTETLLMAIRSVHGGSRYFSPDLLNRVDFSAAPESDQEAQLTKREIEILCLMAKEPALTSKDIAGNLFIAKTTVDKHLQNIKEKLDLKTNKALLKFAIEKKLCD